MPARLLNKHDSCKVHFCCQQRSFLLRRKIQVLWGQFYRLTLNHMILCSSLRNSIKGARHGTCVAYYVTKKIYKSNNWRMRSHMLYEISFRDNIQNTYLISNNGLKTSVFWSIVLWKLDDLSIIIFRLHSSVLSHSPGISRAGSWVWIQLSFTEKSNDIRGSDIHHRSSRWGSSSKNFFKSLCITKTCLIFFFLLTSKAYLSLIGLKWSSSKYLKYLCLSS